MARVVFQPATRRSMQQGINQIAQAIRPTLGPLPRIVAIDRTGQEKRPELLDNGGLIARRIIQLQNRHADVGAMFIRDALWRLHDQVGDGTATAAVLFQKVFNEGVRYLAAGGNAARLQIHLEEGLQAIIAHLSDLSIHLSGQKKLAEVAESICYEPDLAGLMGEIFDIIGEYGRLEIRPGRGRADEREYVEGMYWERGVLSRQMLAGQSRLEFLEPAILISDLDIQQPEQLFPALELALRHNIGSLLIVAGKMSEAAIGFLLANKQPDRFQVAAVQVPGWGANQQAAALTDLAILTGGKPFIQAAGDTFHRIQPEDFGQARRVWADQRNFGIIGGKGEARALRRHIANLRAAYNNSEDTVLRGELLTRLGKLLGGSATLWIGGETELQIETRQEIAKRTASAMREAMIEGVVPGGGVALLACRPLLQDRLARSVDPDERAAYRILIEAMAEPMRTLSHNAGYDPGPVMARISRAGNGHGFDVLSGQVVDMAVAGIWDVAAVLKAAVYTAIGGAALALTTDVMVHRREQPTHATVSGPARRKRL